MSDDMICDITQESIKNVLKKFPRKKNAFKEFCDHFGVIEIEELTEDLALEILEIMDSASYIRVMRAKDDERKRIRHENLKLKLEDFLNSNNEIYMILDKVPDCYLICKIIKIMVQSKNINSVFQPYETTDEKIYFINFIVKLSDNFHPTDLMSKFLIKNIKIHKIMSIDDVSRTLHEIC